MSRPGKTKTPPHEGAQNLIGATRDAGGPLSGAYWSELRTFLAVAQLKSYNQAAQVLTLGHQTVSRHVQRLEDVFGVRLLDTSKRGAELTARGRQIVGFLTQLDRQLFSVESDMKSAAEEAEGTVRLAITDGLGLVYVAPAMRAFSAAHPGVRLHLQRPNNLRHLKDDKVDIILSFRAEEDPAIVTARLGSLTLVPYGTSECLAEAARSGAPTFIDSERFASGASFQPWQDYVATGRVAHLCDTSVTYAVMVKAGVGIGLLPTYNDLEPALLRTGSDVEVEIPVYASASAHGLGRAHIAAVFEFLKALFAGTGAGSLPPDGEARPDHAGYSLLFNLREPAR